MQSRRTPVAQLSSLLDPVVPTAQRVARLHHRVARGEHELRVVDESRGHSVSPELARYSSNCVRHAGSERDVFESQVLGSRESVLHEGILEVHEFALAVQCRSELYVERLDEKKPGIFVIIIKC